MLKMVSGDNTALFEVQCNIRKADCSLPITTCVKILGLISLTSEHWAAMQGVLNLFNDVATA